MRSFYECRLRSLADNISFLSTLSSSFSISGKTKRAWLSLPIISHKNSYIRHQNFPQKEEHGQGMLLAQLPENRSVYTSAPSFSNKFPSHFRFFQIISKRWLLCPLSRPFIIALSNFLIYMLLGRFLDSSLSNHSRYLWIYAKIIRYMVFVSTKAIQLPQTGNSHPPQYVFANCFTLKCKIPDLGHFSKLWISTHLSCAFKAFSNCAIYFSQSGPEAWRRRFRSFSWPLLKRKEFTSRIITASPSGSKTHAWLPDEFSL